jgi:CRISPR-associated protein Csh1
MLITEGEAVSIWKFFELVGNNVLPNPLPIFIDEAELPNGEKIGEKINKEVIRVIQEQGERKLTYSQILKKIYDTPTYRSSLSNYYLMFFQFISQKGFRVIDLDFVPSFQYEIKDIAIEEIFPLGGTQQKIISNIFEFEREVVSKIFDGILVSTFENGGLTVRYFFDFADKQSKNLLKGLIDNLERKNKSFYSLLPQVLKYRKAFYDYIYKSKREAIRSLMFHDIMLKGVMDDLRVSTLNNDKEYDLKIKLNIWFSLYYHFDNPKNYKSMTQEQLSLLERTRKIGQQDNERLETDTEFAFAVGQLVRYLLSKSEAGDRTHALLEPFLQKSDIVQLKLAIARAFGTYKHAIAFYKGDTRYTFDRLMDNVMNYPQTAINLKELLPYILGGYFAESVFKKQIEQ